MRTIKELLELVLQRGVGQYGLCSVVGNLFGDEDITNDEYWALDRYMRKNIPVNVFYDWKGNVTTYEWQFWYPIGQKEPREEWLKKHIELNS